MGCGIGRRVLNGIANAVTRTISAPDANPAADSKVPSVRVME